VRQALEGTSQLIDSELDVGGYPEPAPTAAAFVAATWDLECWCIAQISPLRLEANYPILKQNFETPWQISGY
jgi:hypothetical protein